MNKNIEGVSVRKIRQVDQKDKKGPRVPEMLLQEPLQGPFAGG